MGRTRVNGSEVIENLSKVIEDFHGKHLVIYRTKVEVPSVSEFKTVLVKLVEEFANERKRDAFLDLANGLTAKLTSHDIMKRKRLLYMWHELFRKIEREIQTHRSRSKRKVHAKRGAKLYPFGFVSNNETDKRKKGSDRPITALIPRQVDRDMVWNAHDNVGKELYAAEYDLAFRSHHRPETAKQLEDIYASAMMRNHRPGTATIVRNIRTARELTDFSLGSTEISAIGRALTSHSQLHDPVKLFLSGNRIDSTCMKELSSGIRQCKSLRHLNLANNKIGTDGIRRLVDVLSDETSSCALDVLNVSNNNLDDAACALLCKTASTCLKDLNLSKNDVARDTLMELTQQIKKSNFSLESLNLSWTGCGGRDLTLFLKSTTKFSNSLKDLNLSWNSLSKSNTRAIRNVLLSEKSCLQHLNLSYTQLSRDEIRKLSKVLMKNRRLIGLHVEGTLKMIKWIARTHKPHHFSNTINA